MNSNPSVAAVQKAVDLVQALDPVELALRSALAVPTDVIPMPAAAELFVRPSSTTDATVASHARSDLFRRRPGNNAGGGNRE